VNGILVVLRVPIQQVYLLFCLLLDSLFLSACLWPGPMFCSAVPAFPALHQNGTRRFRFRVVYFSLFDVVNGLCVRGKCDRRFFLSVISGKL